MEVDQSVSVKANPPPFRPFRMQNDLGGGAGVFFRVVMIKRQTQMDLQ